MVISQRKEDVAALAYQDLMRGGRLGSRVFLGRRGPPVFFSLFVVREMSDLPRRSNGCSSKRLCKTLDKAQNLCNCRPNQETVNQTDKHANRRSNQTKHHFSQTNQAK